MIVPLYQNPAADGGPLGWLNCINTCTAMQIAFETGNRLRPSGGDVRFCCRNADGSRDTVGGTRPSQNIDAAQRCWGVVLDGRVMPFEDAWALGLRTDRAISFSIVYAVVSGTSLDASPGFRGNHQVLMSGGLIYDPLADGRRPGIPKGPQKWPKRTLMSAAGRYNRTGLGRATVIVATAPVAKPPKYSVLFEPGAFYVYDGGILRHREEFSKATSAPCGAPFQIAWPGGRKRVVQITAGRLAGKMVEPTATHLRLKEAK